MVGNGQWETIALPFNAFSNKWSSYTGEPTVTCASDASVCPKDADLSTIRQLGVWMEGVAGPFHFEIQSVAAANASTIAALRAEV